MIANLAFSLAGKTVLITGASSGIGRATAITCADHGATVIITGRNAEKLNIVLKILKGTGHQKIVADLEKEEELKNLISACPNIHGLVHSAGLVEPYPILYLNHKKIDDTFGLNFYAPVQLTSLLLKNKKIEKGGSIVFISSIASQHPFTGGAAYASSKAALEAFARTVAIESAPKMIRANCLSPALVKTQIFDHVTQNVSEQTIDDHVKKYPLGIGEPEDVANAAVFLLSIASKWITGINIRMDGGLLVGS